MSEHTPTPWRVEKGTTLIWGDCTLFEDGAPDHLGFPVVDACHRSVWDRSGRPDQRDANAAFIVRAANAHDALVAAIDPDILEAISNEIDRSPHRERSATLLAMSKRLRAAIKIASAP